MIASPALPRSKRARSSSMKRTIARAVFAEPMRSRARSTSPVSARVASREPTGVSGRHSGTAVLEESEVRP